MRDGYGRFRWDCRLKVNPPQETTVYDIYYAQTLKFYDELKAGRKFEFIALLS
jgi:hypothetical protein